MFFLKMVDHPQFFPPMSTLTELLKLSLIIFYLIMVDYPVFFPMLSTLTWDTFLTPMGTWGFYLNHVLPPRPSKSCGWGGVVVVVGWPKILVSAPVPLELI